MTPRESEHVLWTTRHVGALRFRVAADPDGVLTWAPLAEIRGDALPAIVHSYTGAAMCADTVEAVANYIAHKLADWITRGHLGRDPMHPTAWRYRRPPE